jgi:hypothetical protein
MTIPFIDQETTKAVVNHYEDFHKTIVDSHHNDILHLNNNLFQSSANNNNNNNNRVFVGNVHMSRRMPLDVHVNIRKIRDRNRQESVQKNA